jgi:F-type H+-transporting ATPase subunit epsilon
MKFQIITPERVVFADEVDQVSLMTTTGEITVMAHHIPLVTVLKPGELRFKKQGEEKSIAVSGGFAEVKSDVRKSSKLDSKCYVWKYTNND